jgi:hypothetical protein
MNTPITPRLYLEPIVSQEKFFYADGSYRSPKESVMQLQPPCYSQDPSSVGALQDLLTSQLPLGKRRGFYGTDFGAGPPPLMNIE